MPTLHQQVRAAYRRTALQPLPPRWLSSHPELRRYPTPESLLQTVRDPELGREADDVVRALADLARRDSEAGTVLLEALVWSVRARLGRHTSAEFRDEVLTELAIVILEAQDLAELDNLPTRLARRAYARTRRRADRRRSVASRESGALHDHIATFDHDPAQLGTDRALLSATLVTIGSALESGRLAHRDWIDCRDGCLAPAIGGRRLQPDRSRTFRGRRAVNEVVVHAG